MRYLRGLTLAAIARAAGTSDRAVSFYLSGERHPRAEVLPRLALAVGLADLDRDALGAGALAVDLSLTARAEHERQRPCRISIRTMTNWA